MTCQRKRLTITTESLVCSRSSSDWRTSVSSARMIAVKAMPIKQRNEPAAGALDQDVVDEYLRKAGSDDGGHHQRETYEHQQADGGLRGAQFAQQQSQALRLAARPLEFSRRLHGERNAGEGEIELGHVGAPASDRGIIDVDVVAVDPFEHHEMIEIPMDDAGHRQFVQRRRAPCGIPWHRSRKVRAARTMLLALLPSRETPHETRSCSSGIHAP